MLRRSLAVLPFVTLALISVLAWALIFVATVGAQEEDTATEETTLIERSAKEQVSETQAQRQQPAVQAQAKLTIKKTGSPNQVAEGKVLTYTIVVENNGTAAAKDVKVTDDLPGHTTFVSATTTRGTCPDKPDPGDLGTDDPDVTCNLGKVPAGKSATITIKVKPTKDAAAAGTITNHAQATANGGINKVTEEDTTVTPDLTIVKEDSPGTIEVGDLLRYNLTVENRGESDAAKVVVRDQLPNKVEYISDDPDQGSCDEQPKGVVECELKTVDAGNTVRVEILVRAKEAGDITNRAQVFAGDAEQAIDEDTESTRVEDDGGGGGGGTGDGSSCQGAEEEEVLSGNGSEDTTTLDIMGTKFRITSNVSNLSSGDSFKIRVTDDNGFEETFTQGADGDRTFTVNEGSGAFTVNIVNPGNADYTVTIEDCTGSDQNGGGGNGGNNNNTSGNNDNIAALDDLNRDLGELTGAERGSGSFRCELFLRIEDGNGFDGRFGRRHAGLRQYFDGNEDLLVQRIEECREREVLADTIPDKRLPDTGGSSLALFAAGVLLVSGLVAGASVFRGGFAGRRRS